jgi:hypothetical protein
MKTMREVRAFVNKMFAEVELPPARVVLRGKHPTLSAQSNYGTYTIVIHGLPVSKSVLRHEVYHLGIGLSLAADIAVEQVLELAERGARRCGCQCRFGCPTGCLSQSACSSCSPCLCG